MDSFFKNAQSTICLFACVKTLKVSFAFCVYSLLLLMGYGSCESIPCKDWPSCDFVIHGHSPKQYCNYKCCEKKSFRHGTFKDGVTCWRHNEHDMGKCLNGSCIPIEAYESECDGKYRGYGYATSCKYICRQTKRTSNYKDGTPCLKLRDGGGPSKDSPGLCIDGKCTKYKRLGPRYPQPENEVFPYALRRCGDKTHSGKKPVDTCRHYCKQDGNWFFGFYESNTRCKRGRFKPRGYCCRRKCKKKVECWNERATLKEETK